MASFKKRALKRGGTAWDAMVRVRGYPPNGKTFRTRLEAEQWAARIEAAAHGRTLILGRDVTLATLIDEAIPRLKRPIPAALAYWRRELGDLRLRDVTPTLLAQHRDRLVGAPTRAHGHRRCKPRTGSTVRTYLACLSSVFRIGVRELRWCDTTPVREVTLPPCSRGRTRYLLDDERRALLAACRESDAPALYALVMLCVTTGCRRGEAYALRWRDVDLPRRWAVFPKTKNGDARGVPLVPDVVKELERLPRNDSRVFPQDMGRAWDTAVRRANIDDLRFHDLRHSAASRLVQSGANLVEIAEVLGHRDIRMTRRYAHLSNDHTRRLLDRVMSDIAHD
jgi:integrase